MATSLAAMTARRAAAYARLSTSTTRAASLVPRRGLAGAAEGHGTPRINIWEDPMSPSKWKEEHFVIASLTGWFVLIYGGYKLATGGKKDKGEKAEEPAKVAAPAK